MCFGCTNVPIRPLDKVTDTSTSNESLVRQVDEKECAALVSEDRNVVFSSSNDLFELVTTNGGGMRFMVDLNCISYVYHHICMQLPVSVLTFTISVLRCHVQHIHNKKAQLSARQAV